MHALLPLSIKDSLISESGQREEINESGNTGAGGGGGVKWERLSILGTVFCSCIAVKYIGCRD